MLERRSLLNLIDISKHRTLSQAVHAVELSVHHLIRPTEYRSENDLRADRIYHLEDEAERVRRGQCIHPDDVQDREESPCPDPVSYQHCWEEGVDLIQKGLHAEFLLKALSGLPNCKTLGVSDDGQPWGAARLTRYLSIRPNRTITEVLPSSMAHASAVVRLLIRAMMQTDAPLEEIYIDFGHSAEGCTCVVPPMLATPPSVATQASGRLSTITTLHLVVNPAEQANSSSFRGTVAQGDARPSWSSDLLSFIALFPVLSDLSLIFYLANEVHFPELSERLRIPRLQSLHLENLDCTKQQLGRLLRAHKRTLQDVSLENVTLQRGSYTDWSSLIRTLRRRHTINNLTLERCLVDQGRRTFSTPSGLLARDRAQLDSLLIRLMEWEDDMESEEEDGRNNSDLLLSYDMLT
ncbi:hypothetical protein LX36DRAFT_661390 [Colletotrichum falcatum]|nr:hypothetical protein LX36DRAFT_661390 [Colletotrichum falcatum]